MPSKPSVDAADCLQHAAGCELQAEAATDPAAKRFFLDLADRWRRTAELFRYVERDRLAPNP
jgi:hypothetical protein